MYTKFNPETDVLPLVDAKARINDRIEAEEKRRLAILAEYQKRALRYLNHRLLDGYSVARYYFDPCNCSNRDDAIAIANELKERFINARYEANVIEYSETNKKHFVSLCILVP